MGIWEYMWENSYSFSRLQKHYNQAFELKFTFCLSWLWTMTQGHQACKRILPPLPGQDQYRLWCWRGYLACSRPKMGYWGRIIIFVVVCCIVVYSTVHYSFLRLLKHDFKNKALFVKTQHTIHTSRHTSIRTPQIFCKMKHFIQNFTII